VSGALLLEELLRVAVDRGASDIHLKVPSPPALRLDGRLERLAGFAPVKPAVTEDVLAVMLASLPHSSKQNDFERAGDVDFAYAHPGLGRFRVNAFRQRGSVSMVIRLVPFGIPHADELGIPPVVQSLVGHPDGLVIVTGAAGSGVTTTLAALVDVVNRTAVRSILTFEDPIELLHTDQLSTVSQREIGLDTPSFAQGLDRALRHDPDVVTIGALPDLASIEAALTLAQSGVLVLVAQRSADAGTAITRIIDAYPDDRHRRARADLASSLRGVVVQQLLPRADGAGRCLATEVLLGTPEVRESIADSTATHEIVDHLDRPGNDGLLSLNSSLAHLVLTGAVTFEAARAAARDAVALERDLASRARPGSDAPGAA
jgi:twitching motility protein PilT